LTCDLFLDCLVEIFLGTPWRFLLFLGVPDVVVLAFAIDEEFAIDVRF
jgi:hypothetical protein